jgi:hypothetical protein
MPAVSTWPSATSTVNSMPAYLADLAKSGDLMARDGDRIINAPAADNEVLRSYPEWSDKGPLVEPAGQRLTVLTAKSSYAVGEEVRVVHVHEATKAGVGLYVMGPKAIYGEYVDGALVGKAMPDMISYDGVVVPSPGEDHNYEVTVHHFSKGQHTLQWRFVTMSGEILMQSNTLTFDVTYKRVL